MEPIELQSEVNQQLIHRALAESFHLEYNEEVQRFEFVRFLPRPYSLTAFLDVHTGTRIRRIVLKHVREHPLNVTVIDEANQWAVEYRILRRLHSRFQGIDGCAVPRPLVELPEIDAFVMEYVDGTVLSDRFKCLHYAGNSRDFREVQDRFFDCGRWLRYFHEFTGCRTATIGATDNVVLRSKDRLRIIDEYGRCPPGFRELATEFIQHQLDCLADSEVLVTGRHGDFGPWNTLADPTGVTVLDFFGYREDPLPVDIFGVLVCLEAIAYEVANSGVRIRALRERFMEGLGDLPTLPEPLILLCEAQQRIQQIATAAIATGGGFRRRWERSRVIRANLNWFAARPTRSLLWPARK